MSLRVWAPLELVSLPFRERSLEVKGRKGLKILMGNRDSLNSASSMLRRRFIGDGGRRSAVESLVQDEPTEGAPVLGKSRSRSR